MENNLKLSLVMSEEYCDNCHLQVKLPYDEPLRCFAGICPKCKNHVIGETLEENISLGIEEVIHRHKEKH